MSCKNDRFAHRKKFPRDTPNDTVRSIIRTPHIIRISVNHSPGIYTLPRPQTTASDNSTQWRTQRYISIYPIFLSRWKQAELAPIAEAHQVPPLCPSSSFFFYSTYTHTYLLFFLAARDVRKTLPHKSGLLCFPPTTTTTHDSALPAVEQLPFSAPFFSVQRTSLWSLVGRGCGWRMCSAGIKMAIIYWCF